MYHAQYFAVKLLFQMVPALSLLHKHLSLMLPLSGEILSNSVSLLQQGQTRQDVRDMLQGSYISQNYVLFCKLSHNKHVKFSLLIFFNDMFIHCHLLYDNIFYIYVSPFNLILIFNYFFFSWINVLP